MSQICAFTVQPLARVTFLVANSTPMVGAGFFGRVPFKYWFSKQVFPTEASPTRITAQIKVVKVTFV